MYSFEGLGFVNPAVKPVRASPATGKSCSRYRVLTRVSTPTAPQGPPDLSNLKAGIARPERYTSSDWARNLTNLPRSAVLRRIQYVARDTIFKDARCLTVVHTYSVLQIALALEHFYGRCGRIGS